VKHCVGRAGFDVGKPRLPLAPLDEATAAKIDAVVSRYKVDLPVAVGAD
jgi:dihydrodipicolinate synthase/N-acetylneuraminate lyase